MRPILVLSDREVACANYLTEERVFLHADCTELAKVKRRGHRLEIDQSVRTVKKVDLR